jgi:hypothetical protein
MPPLDELTRQRLGRALVSLEGAIAQFEAQRTEDAEPNVRRLQRLSDDIHAVLRLSQPHAEPT